MKHNSSRSSNTSDHAPDEPDLLVGPDESGVPDEADEFAELSFDGVSLSPVSPQRQVVGVDVTGRLDAVLTAMLASVSRSRVRAWIDSGAVRVNNHVARARDAVATGDVIELDPPPDPRASAFAAEDIALAVVHGDSALYVIDKPAGLVVHPAAGNWSGTLVNALLFHDPALAAVPRAGIVHRLDADTSGLMVVARTLSAHANLVQQLQARSVRREYWAVAFGTVPAEGVIETPIGRDPRNRLRFRARSGRNAREARTWFKRLATGAIDGMPVSWLACKLDTGRTHQIRVHLESIGHPLVGDATYIEHRPALASHWHERPTILRQALHAAILGLDHPSSHERMSWHRLPPADFRALLRKAGCAVPRSVRPAFGAV